MVSSGTSREGSERRRSEFVQRGPGGCDVYGSKRRRRELPEEMEQHVLCDYEDGSLCLDLDNGETITGAEHGEDRLGL